MERILTFCIFTLACTTAFNGTIAAAGRLSEVLSEARVEHARELLGKRYDKSQVKAAEGVPALEVFVYQAVTMALPKRFEMRAQAAARTILEESERYRMDPIFLIALMKHESRFNPEALGTHGEIGLMQIKPMTARWIASKIGLPWKGPQSLKDMPTNIRIGAAYLAMLRKSFSAKSSYYLAAYNLGAAGVKRRIGHVHVPSEYPRHVMAQYLELYRQLSESTSRPQSPEPSMRSSVLAFLGQSDFK